MNGQTKLRGRAPATGNPRGASRTPTGRPSGAYRPRGVTRPARRGGVRQWLSDPDHRFAAGKWALIAALAAYCWLMLGANSAKDVPFSKVEAAMAVVPGLEELERLDEDDLWQRFGVTAEGVEDWMLYGSGDIMNVSELWIARTEDADILDRLEAAAQGRVDAQLEVFRSYGVGQKELLEGAMIEQRGSFLFYGVSEYAEQWEAAFLSCMR